jgi:signal transduction histidine kinase
MNLQLKFMIVFLAISSSIIVISYIAIISSRQSLENSIGQTSIGLASKTMTAIDQNIYDKIILFETLANSVTSQNIVMASNNDFSKIPNVDGYINQKEDQWISNNSLENPIVRQSVENPLSNQLKSISEFLKDTTYYSIVSQMIITNAYGVNVAETGMTDHYEHSNEEWWKIAKNDYLYVGDKDLSEQKYAIDIGIRIDDKNGSFIGARKVVMNLDEIINVIKDAQRKSQYSTSEFLLLTKDGKLIYSTQSFKIYEDLSNTSFFKSMNGSKGYFEDTEDQKSKLITYAKSTGYSDYNGLGWILVIKYNTDEILKPVSDLTYFIAYATILVLIMGIISSIIISKHLARRITILRNAANKIAVGDFTTQVDMSGNDEIHDLAKDIDLMSKVLSENTQQLLKNERLSAIGELAARIAHDLRNPLNIIKNGLEIIMIKNPNLDQKTKEDFTRIMRSIWRMTHQIDEVLDYIRFTPLELKSHDIGNILKNTIEGMGIPETVKINLPENNAVLSCDSEKIAIVFSNLITNSIQAMKNKGQIDIKIIEDIKNAVIAITDSGPGIPENILPKIFDPLFTTKQVGTGLGLVSCKNIIERHGGSISVKNNPTTFTITIPKNDSTKILDSQKSDI